VRALIQFCNNESKQSGIIVVNTYRRAIAYGYISWRPVWRVSGKGGMDQLWHEITRVVLTKGTLFVLLLSVARLIFLTALEKSDPAHDVSYRNVLPRDILVAAIFSLVVLPAADFLDRKIMFQPVLPGWVFEWPLAIRIMLYVVLADFGYYWVHRLMHTRHLWRTHKWHHSPTYMYWLAGVRGSITQQTLTNIPYIAAGAFLSIATWWMVWAIVVKNIAQNDFMHLNLWWGNRWLERVIVTPRYHHVHHSDDPAHYGGNLAALFSIWDHLFGTYVDPEKVTKNITFGIGESVSTFRLFVGV
jgi:sterol desaturase/sphingolipid hydroxylase (fatty acid hydroxylase superfamily)